MFSLPLIVYNQSSIILISSTRSFGVGWLAGTPIGKTVQHMMAVLEPKYWHQQKIWF